MIEKKASAQLVTCRSGYWSFRPEYGFFSGDIETVWWDDGVLLQLTKTVFFRDRRGVMWPAYAGNIVNGSNIPWRVWSVMQRSPMSGRHRVASVFHDVACVERKAACVDVHMMFYEACLAAGEDEVSANTMGAAVALGGPKWGEDEKRIDASDCDDYMRGVFCLGRA
jgi:hypothetical protein